jgi:hypothetical protein
MFIMSSRNDSALYLIPYPANKHKQGPMPKRLVH